jgi:hypothetical protein
LCLSWPIEIPTVYNNLLFWIKIGIFKGASYSKENKWYIWIHGNNGFYLFSVKPDKEILKALKMTSRT